ncbi:hypothetical protein FUT87_20710 [Mitsuaria sp. TWR114]|uniref:hypothetical protein n=1 Tax=Mitsuaria sp. TWR114 TaxID=2601731 RepID=UPI0011BE244E|nr:hypothetical protein [Mitsuaria sp. TWR114]TXD80078.1 hypothetical protein FUT87_20710 [Mitsuaria sp. TWR114]
MPAARRPSPRRAAGPTGIGRSRRRRWRACWACPWTSSRPSVDCTGNCARWRPLGAQATGEAVRAGGEAVATLLGALDDAEHRAPDAPLQWTLLRHAGPSRWTDRAAFTANRLALIWQSHEAGAALLGHALLGDSWMGGAPTREALLRLARDGGAVRVTRRFDVRQQPPAPVTVQLAGTDHPFGDGAHRCPGQGLALGTSLASLQWLAEQPGLRPPTAVAPLALPNMDIPQFKDEELFP